MSMPPANNPSTVDDDADDGLDGLDVLSDDELTAFALAADPDQPPDPDAVPFDAGSGAFPELLPAWYMPAPIVRARKRWHVAVVVLLIIAFAMINLLGLCITYGRLVIA